MSELDKQPITREMEYYDLFNSSPYGDGNLYAYHSGTSVWATSKNAQIRFGYEAEKEDSKGKKVAEAYQGYQDELLPFDFRAERDGSLGYNGFELISPIYNLNDDKYLDHLRDPVLSFLMHSDTTFRCGGHITISVKNWTPENYAEKAAQILPLLYALYPKRAKTSGYSRFYNKDDYRQRYNAINISEEKMEIRLFAGIKTVKQLTWRVKLLRMLFKIDVEKGYQAVYDSLLDMSCPLANHIHQLYKKKYGEKIMLTHAYHKAYEKETITWKDYTKIRTKIPTAVVARMQIHPEPVNNNLKQLRIDVCDYCEDGVSEA